MASRCRSTSGLAGGDEMSGVRVLNRQQVMMNPPVHLWRGEGEKSPSPWGIRWSSTSREYSEDYGAVTGFIADVSHPLDLRRETDTGGKPYLPERTVEEWVEILRRKGLPVHILEPDRADDFVSLWDLYDGRDRDYTEATDMMQVLRSSGFDALVVREVGTSGKTYDAYGLIDRL